MILRSEATTFSVDNIPTHVMVMWIGDQLVIETQRDFACSSIQVSCLAAGQMMTIHCLKRCGLEVPRRVLAHYGPSGCCLDIVGELVDYMTTHFSS